MEIIEVLKSKKCWLVMFLSLGLTYLAVKPYLVAGQPQTWLSFFLIISFGFLFSLSLSCNVRLIKTRYQEEKKIRVGKKGLLTSLAYLFGFTALQSCFIGGFCGVNLVISLLALILPATAITVFVHYGFWLLVFTDLIIFYSLIYMGCFKRKVYDK